MKRKKLLLLWGMAALSLTVTATPVKVTMNAVSPTMTLVDSEGKAVETGDPSNKVYEFDAAPGTYILTAYATDKTTVNGTIDIVVTDQQGSIFDDDLDGQYKYGIDDVNQFTVITCTAYVTNKRPDNTAWTIDGGDYSLQVKVNTREGVAKDVAYGKSTTAGRNTFLALNGNSYNVAFVPSDAHSAEGYMTLYRGGTLTANVNVYGAIPQGDEFAVTVPSGAALELGMKFTHFTDFTLVEPDEVKKDAAGDTYVYTLAHGQVYNYRTWKGGGLTHAGYFTMNADAAKRPAISFADADFSAHSPTAVNHSPQSNNGYETGDLFLNINPEGHLRMNADSEFLVHAMRTWELTDNSTNNYFFEPDFHYTVLDTDFKPSTNVIEIENADTRSSAWSKIKAKNAGTAIVLVTYDGINLNYYNNADKRDYLGGEYWGAIWPENTGVFVVTVGDGVSDAKPNMVVNEQYNVGALRLAGKYVDAEHDVFYYLDTEEGFPFTFTPEGVASVSVARPEVSESAASYAGFTDEGVSRSDEGAYTVMLHKGRNIVRLTDASGRSVYQVLTAKPCHREITNVTREGSKIFQPGDQFKIQYSGLFHPANKIAGIYNMSAYVTYNGTPNGSSLILGSGQYTFGSAASAQAVTVEIPEDYDVAENPAWKMSEGVIQVNGYGDPIGNHRNISPLAGRSPNFTAVPHKTYFGSIPDIVINLSPVKTFEIALSGAPAEAEIHLDFNGKEIFPNEAGLYSGTYGSYSLVSKADGYQCFRKTYEIADDAQGLITFEVAMELLGDAWDGVEKTQPALNSNGIYEISRPAHLAWFAENVNTKGAIQKAVVTNDLNLGNFDWSAIGASSSAAFTGDFDGQGHTISGLYINATTSNIGLFGYMKDGHIAGLTVEGAVSGKQYVGGVVGNVTGASTIDRCASKADVKGTSTYVGGVVGYFNSATAQATNLYNTGTVTGTTNCGGVIGSNNKDASIKNIFNVGAVRGTTVGGCIGGTTAKNNVENAFSIFEHQIVEKQTLVTPEQMASGEVAHKLGDAFFQTIGVDAHPSFAGHKVYHDSDTDEYYNLADSFEIALGEGNEGVEVKDGAIVMDNKETYPLQVASTPAGARLPEIAWSTSNDDIVEVSSEGVLSARAIGEALITASADIDGSEVVSTCSVKVIAAEALEMVLEADSEGRIINVYDIAGRIVKLGVKPADCRSLAPGLYVIRYGSDAKTVMVK